jgi:hypothetical protein
LPLAQQLWPESWGIAAIFGAWPLRLPMPIRLSAHGVRLTGGDPVINPSLTVGQRVSVKAASGVYDAQIASQEQDTL